MAPQFDEAWFSSKDNTRLYLRSCRAKKSRATVAMVHGYGDHSGRYVHVMEFLAQHDISSLAIDHRGHGKADGRRGDVHHWSDYVDDTEAFFAKAKSFSQGEPLFWLGHSNGALISIHFMAQPRPEINGLILCSPFLQLAFAPPALKLFGARLIQGILPHLHISNELKIEHLSRDVAWQKSSAEDPLYLRVTTPRWFFETKAAQERLAGTGPQLKLPILMIAGTDDQIASMPAAKAFFDTLGASDKTLKEYEGFRHEVLNELEKERPLSDIERWISQHC